MIEIKVLGSSCTRSDYYLEVITKIAKELGINTPIKKVIEPEELEKYDVSIGCLYAYCPGCNFIHKKNSSAKLTPALVVNGELKLHSCFPLYAEFRKALLF